MPSTFIFGCLKLKMRFLEIPFPKSIVYSDLALDKLRQRYESFFSIKNAETLTMKVADVHAPCVLQFSKLLGTMFIRKRKLFVEKKFQE